MQHQISFAEVHGYATYVRAQKRGQEVEIAAKAYVGPREEHRVRWLVIALPSGRFVPAFCVADGFPGGPGFFLNLTNVCCFN